MDEIKDLTIPEKWQEKFDLVVKECSGALSTGVNSIKDSLVVMNGIRSLRKFFYLPEVKELVVASQDTKAGFMTDRNPAAIRRHNARKDKKYDLKPYSYDQIVDALLPCVLDGYRMHGNEINIISGSGLGVKNGKHRKIVSEHTQGFREKIGVPTEKPGERGFIFIRCSAEWQIKGIRQNIGVEDDDACVFKIKYDGGKYDSMDKVIGLAQSKLYTRVLTRITGKFIPDDPQGEVLGVAEEIEPNNMSDASKAPPRRNKTEPKKEAVENGVPEGIVPAIEELRVIVKSPEYNEVYGPILKAAGKTYEDAGKALHDETGETARAILDILKEKK